MTYPIDVYISEISDKRKYSGIEDQAIWLTRNRSLVVPQAVRDSFIKLEKIARDNKVSFPDLVVYALGAEQAERAQVTKEDLLAVRALLAKAAKLQPNPHILTDKAGVAISGFDLVEAAPSGAKELGNGRFAILHDGAIWIFKNKTNQELFERDPQRYIPGFGGYCIVELARGRKSPGFMEYLIRHKGKAYLACSLVAKEYAVNNFEEVLNAATENWKRLSDAPEGKTALTNLGKALLEKEEPKTKK